MGSIQLFILLLSILLNVEDCEACGGTYTTNTGTLTSPNYPNNYGNDLNCVWNISVSNSVVYLKIDDFQVEFCRFPCRCDHFQVSDAVTLRKITQKICGPQLPMIIYTDTNSVQIKFKTDGSATYTGWSLTWGVSAPCEVSTEVIDESEVNKPAIYVCDAGYEISMILNTPRCQQNRTWSPPPACSVYCEEPPAGPGIFHYHIAIRGGRLNKTAVYHCKAGYEIYTSSNTTTCQRDGTWSPAAVCAAPCKALPEVEHSQFPSIIGSRLNKTAAYTCDAGYEISTSFNSARCQLNGTWSPTPACSAKDCGSPPDIRFGEIQLDTEVYTTFNSFINYRCVGLGYDLIGSEIVRCTENGTWTSPPSCRKKICGIPPTVMKAERTIHGVFYNDSTSYECDTGYELTGNVIIYCQLSGYWMNPPTCRALNCGEPPEISNTMDVSAGNHTLVGDKLSYECLTGYQINGHPTVECLPSLQWSAPPQCSTPCEAPPEVEHSQFPSIIGSRLDNIAAYTCDTGYEISTASNTARCQLNGTWTLIPVCSEISCGPPSAVLNSARTVNGQFYNNTTTYECETGYELIGNGTIYCQAIGEWMVPPSCRALNCGEPPEVDNALNASIISGTSVGDKVSYVCQSGYQMSGHHLIECLRNQQWSRPPVCVEIGHDTQPPKTDPKKPIDKRKDGSLHRSDHQDQQTETNGLQGFSAERLYWIVGCAVGAGTIIVLSALAVCLVKRSKMKRSQTLDASNSLYFTEGQAMDIFRRDAACAEPAYESIDLEGRAVAEQRPLSSFVK